MKVAIVQANLGGIDKPSIGVKQTMAHDYHLFTDENFPPRDKSMTPRLQAKIPKMFAWQLAPGYDYYMWLDGNLSFKNTDTLKYFLDNCEDVVVLQHHDRNTIYWEYRYNYRGLHNNAPSNYLWERYANELLDEQFNEINNYADSPLYQGGIFIYRNCPEVQAMLKEWWYHVSRYLIMDQLSWSYVLKKSGLKVKALPDNFKDLLDVKRHKKHT